MTRTIARALRAEVRQVLDSNLREPQRYHVDVVCGKKDVHYVIVHDKRIKYKDNTLVRFNSPTEWNTFQKLRGVGHLNNGTL